MSAREYAGTAFPLPASEYGGNGPEYGMDLRDWFAGQALVGLLAQSKGTAFASPVATAAVYCYLMADAMIEERKK